MKIFAIGDLHLSLARPKEMDVFGSHWKDHFERIRVDWESRVSGEDVVLIPGDISWAMHLKDALPDLDAIAELPGRKIMIRGNHDYWWSSMNKVQSVLGEGMHIIQNNCIEVDDIVFCGTRGWAFPMEGSTFSEEDKKIYEREKIRLKMSLDAAGKCGKHIIVMMHYPPMYEQYQHTEFTEIISSYVVSDVVFGHLHGEVLNQVHLTDIQVDGIRYNLVSADYLDFRLRRIA